MPFDLDAKNILAIAIIILFMTGAAHLAYDEYAIYSVRKQERIVQEAAYQHELEQAHKDDEDRASK